MLTVAGERERDIRTMQDTGNCNSLAEWLEWEGDDESAMEALAPCEELQEYPRILIPPQLPRLSYSSYSPSSTNLRTKGSIRKKKKPYSLSSITYSTRPIDSGGGASSHSLSDIFYIPSDAASLISNSIRLLAPLFFNFYSGTLHSTIKLYS